MMKIVDRRAANRQRTHEAILSAAHELVRERQQADFSFEELATHADVSRRTVFNHFSTRDDLTLALCNDILAAVIEDFRRCATEVPVGDSSRDDYFDAIFTALAATDLPGAIRTIVRILPENETDERVSAIMHQALTLLDGVIRSETMRRLPGTDEFQVDLFVSALVNGLATASEHWLKCGVEIDQASDDDWRPYFHAVITQLRHGHLTPAPPSTS